MIRVYELRKSDNNKIVGIIDKILVTCNEENTASEHVILKNGGIFEKSIDVDGRIIKRYWITLN